MRIAHQAWLFVVPEVVVGFFGLGLTAQSNVRLFGTLLFLLGAGSAVFTTYFFRDPDRPLPTNPDKLYAPGDGVVLSVAREGPSDRVTVRIFLSIFDVHVQRAPCAGRISHVQVVDGSFVAAMKDAARYNARVAMSIAPGAGRGTVVVEQIAGLIARRIECWPRQGDSIAAGQRYGIIYFGSQAAVHFPQGAKCTLNIGDRVTAGVTEIGEWTSTT